jgi:hypothetical protein
MLGGDIDLQHLCPLSLSAFEKGFKEEVCISLLARTSHEAKYKHLPTSSRVVEKCPSAAFLSPFVVAAYAPITPHSSGFRVPPKRDFTKLNLHLGIFEQPE